VSQRVVVFLDYQNVYHRARDAFCSPPASASQGQVDPLALGRLLAGRVPGGCLTGVRVYRGRPSQRRDSRSHAACRRQTARQVGRGGGLVVVLSRELRYPPDWPRRPAEEKGIDVALAGRLVRLIDYYEDTIEELRAKYGGEGEEGADAGGGAAAPPPAGSRERAQADLASLRRQVRELRRRSALAAAAARQLGLELVVSYHSDEFGRGPGSPAPPRRRGGPLRRRPPRRRRRRGAPRRHPLRAAGAAHHERAVTASIVHSAS
jgi:hypothetical protein